MKIKFHNPFKLLILFFFTTFLIWPAIYNGYPLVFSDSGTYIIAGYINEIPIDRPIFYSLFVKLMSLSYSLWLVVFAQSLMVSFVIYMLVRKFISSNVILLSIGLISILSFTTGLSNYASQIMPDILCAIPFIGIAIIITTETMKWKEYVLSLIIIFCSMTNFSFLLVLLGIGFVIVILSLFRMIKYKMLYRTLVISILPIFIVLVVNKSYTGKFQISKAGNVFILARMIETGIVKQYLDENCHVKNYKFCDQLNKLSGSSAQFLWDEKSVLYDDKCLSSGWGSCWEEKNDEFGKIASDIATTSKYSKQLLSIYLKDFFRQIIDFKIGILIPMRENTSPQYCINEKFRNEMKFYKNSNQYKKALEFKTMSLIQLIFVAFSGIGLILILLFYKLKIKREHNIIIIILGFGFIGNAMSVVLFSTEVDRYQSRIIWIIPLIALLMFYRYIVEKRNAKSNSL